jgi:hypothetical protein
LHGLFVLLVVDSRIVEAAGWHAIERDRHYNLSVGQGQVVHQLFTKLRVERLTPKHSVRRWAACRLPLGLNGMPFAVFRSSAHRRAVGPMRAAVGSRVERLPESSIAMAQDGMGINRDDMAMGTPLGLAALLAGTLVGTVGLNVVNVPLSAICADLRAPLSAGVSSRWEVTNTAQMTEEIVGIGRRPLPGIRAHESPIRNTDATRRRAVSARSSAPAAPAATRSTHH